MKVSDIFVAGLFMTMIVALTVQIITWMSIFHPEATTNLTNTTTSINNLSAVQQYNLTDEAMFLRDKLENLTAQGNAGDFLTQLTTAFGLSVFFGLEVIKAFFIGVITLPLTILGTISVILNGIGYSLLGQAYGYVAVPLALLIMVVIVISVSRLFKPDL